MTVYRIVPFKGWHVSQLRPKDEGAKPWLTPETLAYMEREQSFTLFVDDEVVLCAGVLVLWPGRYSAWAYMNEKTARHMLFITRAAQQFLAFLKGRTEATVRCDFAAGHRWAKMLGFEVETPVLKKYGPWGEDHTGYVRILE